MCIRDSFLSTLFNLAPLLFFVFFILWMSGRFSGGMGSGGMGGGIFSVGKSKAKMYEKGNAIGITFKDCLLYTSQAPALSIYHSDMH